MEKASAKMEGTSSINTSGFLYEVAKGAGKVGGYIHHLLTDTMYYAGKSVSYLRRVCSDLKVSRYEKRGETERMTVQYLVKNDAAIDEADKRGFYMNLGRDIVALTKAGIESDHLTIIDLSKYEL